MKEEVKCWECPALMGPKVIGPDGFKEERWTCKRGVFKAMEGIGATKTIDGKVWHNKTQIDYRSIKKYKNACYYIQKHKKYFKNILNYLIKN
jgi:hypothetical protein